MCGLSKKADMLTEFLFTTVKINLESISLFLQYFLIFKQSTKTSGSKAASQACQVHFYMTKGQLE